MPNGNNVMAYGPTLTVSQKRSHRPFSHITARRFVGRKDSALIHICMPHVPEFEKNAHRFMPDRSDKGRGPSTPRMNRNNAGRKTASLERTKSNPPLALATLVLIIVVLVMNKRMKDGVDA